MKALALQGDRIWANKYFITVLFFLSTFFTSRAASVRGASSQEAGSPAARSQAEGEAEGEAEADGAWSVADALSPGSVRDDDDDDAPDDGYVVPVRGDTAANGESKQIESTFSG